MKNKRNKLHDLGIFKKSNAGITLIALVVTIVVLLILAGVSLNLVIGQNGIINKASEAKEKTELATLNEQNGMNNMYDEIEEILNRKKSSFKIIVDDNGTERIYNYETLDEISIYSWAIKYEEDHTDDVPETIDAIKRIGEGKYSCNSARNRHIVIYAK